MEEQLDILTPEGVPTGQVAPYSKIHAQGAWHQTVHVWILTPDGQLLMQLRGPKMDICPNTWDISSAGHVIAGESLEQGARREIQEETGLQISADQLERIGQVKNDSQPAATSANREFQTIYLIRQPIELGALRPQASEITKFRLTPWRELQRQVAAGDTSLTPHPEEYQLLFSYLEQHSPYANTN